jgi:lactose/L-arabinose transport system substrate-binding protein
MPWDSGPVGLYYRADLFQKAGIEVSTIQTWDDYLKAGQRLQALDPKLKLLAFYPNDDTLFRVLMSQQGASYFTQDGKINLTSPEALRALNLIKQMYTAKLLSTVSDPNGIIPALRTNEAASYVAPATWATTLQDNAPEMTGKWDIMPIPTMPEAVGRSANLGGSMLAALRTGKNQEAASAFIEYCLANKANQNLMLKQAGLLPSFLPAYEDPFYNSPQPFFNNRPIWQFFAREVGQLKLAYYTKDFELASDAATTAQLLALLRLEPYQALQKKANDLKDLTSREVFKPEPTIKE